MNKEVVGLTARNVHSGPLDPLGCILFVGTFVVQMIVSLYHSLFKLYALCSSNTVHESELSVLYSMYTPSYTDGYRSALKPFRSVLCN